MRQIVYLLSGNEVAPPLLDRQIDRFVQRMRDDIEDILWNANFTGSSLVPDLIGAYEALSVDRLMGFFTSPQGFNAVCMAGRDTSAGNLENLLTELRAAAASLDDPAWPAEKEIELSSAPERLLLGGMVTVDLGTRHCRRIDVTSPVFANPFEEFTVREAEVIRRKLHTAFCEIERIAPVLARMIRNYTRVVYIRKAEGRLLSSEQVDTELGAIRLLNVHSDMYSQDQVVDDLIHESIHNLLGTYEYLNFPFIPVGHRPPAELRPVSPWSMRAIQLLPFLHAAFVYFGMLSYAEKALKEEGIVDTKRHSLLKRRNRYASGFLMPGDLSDLAASLGDADPRVLTALDWMQRSVRSKLGSTGAFGGMKDIGEGQVSTVLAA